MNQYFCSMIWW